MVTIADVAKEAGVSLSTASRALNNSVVVSQEKKDRVAEAVKKLGYRPIRISTARRAQQSKIILVITAMLHNEMLDSIRKTAGEMGYQTVVAFVGEAQDDGYRNALEIVKMLPANLLCGLIFVHNQCWEKNLWAEFCSYPLVQVGESQPMSPKLSVTIDDHEAAYDMTQYLLRKGYRDIVYVSSGDQTQYSYCRPRQAGFEDAMADAGLPVGPESIMRADYVLDGGTDVAQRLLKMKKLPDAVFCSSDYMALGCIAELQKNGVKVPEEIAVSGFDNIEASEYCQPRLTTVGQPYEEMGAEAVRLLDMLYSGVIASGRRVIASHVILERESA